MPEIIGLILAGGRGRRFDPTGRRNKLLATLPDGQSVLHHSCRNMLAWVDRLVVVTGPQIVVLRPTVQDLDIGWAECPSVDLGIGTTLKAGIAHTKPGLGWLVGLADMPFVTPQTYRAMVEALRTGARLARPVLGDQPGHPVACAVAMRDALAGLPDEAGLAALARIEPGTLRKIQVNDPGCVRDIDFPGDLPSMFPPFLPSGQV